MCYALVGKNKRFSMKKFSERNEKVTTEKPVVEKFFTEKSDGSNGAVIPVYR